MEPHTHRTTIKMKEELYRETKKLSVDLHKDFQTIVCEAMESYLPVLRKEAGTSQKGFRLKTYNLGGYKGLSREKIYED